MVKLKRKLLASTMIEVIIALVIIVIANGIALMIILNVRTTRNSRLKIKAMIQVEQVLSETNNELSYFDEDYDREGIKIEKKILPYSDNKNLQILQIKALNVKKHVLLEVKELVKVEN